MRTVPPEVLRIYLYVNVVPAGKVTDVLQEVEDADVRAIYISYQHISLSSI